MAQPCPHVLCSSCSQRDKCLHHVCGADELEDRGWIPQFYSVPCSSGNKRVCLACSKGLLMGTLVSARLSIVTKQRSSSSRAQSFTQSWISPGFSPHSCGFIYCITLTLSVPVNPIFCIYSPSFHCQASKKNLFCVKPTFVHKHSIKSIKSILVLFLPSVLPHFVPAQTNN